MPCLVELSKTIYKTVEAHVKNEYILKTYPLVALLCYSPCYVYSVSYGLSSVTVRNTHSYAFSLITSDNEINLSVIHPQRKENVVLSR